MKPLVSLCIPTNGVVEWVFPVLDSIYSQNVDEGLFEVVITDNGKNKEFKSLMQQYINSHFNLIYAETEALSFLNEIESYKRANGELIKFVNHRTKLVGGTLHRLLETVEQYREVKPIIYFSNGMLNIKKGKNEYDTFDQFVKNLSYWSSCSTGMAMWKEDFDKLPEDVSSFNELFPHTNVLFNERTRGKYIIDNSVIFKELPQGYTPKGRYDLFYAFGIEYLWIICTLLIDGDVSFETFQYVKKENLKFMACLYYDYKLRKKYCSYDLSGLKNVYGVFYTYAELKRSVITIITCKLIKKLFKRWKCEKNDC